MTEPEDLPVDAGPAWLGPRASEDDPPETGRASRVLTVRAVIPNAITAAALCSGLTGIRFAINHDWRMALFAIILAGVLDGIDGRIARLLKAQSRFGAELDSLADFVNFGVAPAIIIYNWALDDLKSMGWIVVLIYAVCAALRLARFNVALERTDQPAWQKSYFVGVPAPAGAIVLLLPIYAQDLGLHLPVLTPLILLYTVAIALLMVSRVPTFSGKMIGQKIPREHVPPLFVLAALFIGSLLTYPSLTLAVGSVIYLALIPVSAYRYFQQERQMEQVAKAQNGKGLAEPPAIEPPSLPR